MLAEYHFKKGRRRWENNVIIDVDEVSTRSPAPIAHAVRGTDFPASKDDLIDQARENGADEDVIEQIEQMPEGEYESMADVFAGVGEANR